jgi:hypothetical protein
LLRLVEGAGTADGLGSLARTWAGTAARAGEIPRPNLPSPLCPGRITAEDVFAAAARDDPTATRIVDRPAHIT